MATFIGMIVSALFIGMALSDPWAYVNLPSLLIVAGGTFGAILTNYPLGVVLRTGGLIRKAMTSYLPPVDVTVRQLLDFAHLARREGILAIEPSIKELPDPYLRKGLRLMVDGMEPQAIQTIMENEINNTESRHDMGVEMLTALASYAPALGLIGTVIGLVSMLGNMKDPASIGPAMAVALLTTFYGAVMANLIFLPICGKLKHRSRQEVFIMEMQLAGILGIARGENPRLVKEMLEGFQPPRNRANSD
ncbi:MAG: motility protein A [Deltaproteobacteria bacterium]|jgi:chemotaxis protein MotA|nr:motility protein A [Deltaproteobacteria bacterium]